jgi:hypothetical protein
LLVIHVVPPPKRHPFIVDEMPEDGYLLQRERESEGGREREMPGQLELERGRDARR